MENMSPRDILPFSLPPRGLQRVVAAAYVGVGPTKFDQMVDDGRMPRPKRIDARKIWDRLEIDVAITELPQDGDRDDSKEWRDA